MKEKKPPHFMGTPATAPGPQGPEMLKSIRQIRHNPLSFLELMWKTYGDVVQFPIPKPPTYLVNSPAGVRHVLVNNGRNYGKATIQYKALSLVTGEGLLTADTKKWQRTRPIIQPAFHQALLDDLVPITEAVTDELINQWGCIPTGAVFDVDQYMLSAALDVVGQFLFGANLASNAHEITDATLAALEVVIARARVPISPPSWIPSPANRKLASSVATLDSAVRYMMTERDLAKSHHKNMIDLLSVATDENGRRLSTREVRDEIVTFIVAGHETVASALSWAWATLAADPQLQDSLANEAFNAHISGGASLSNLPATRAFFEEVLRLYPPAWLITRQAREGDVIDGHMIPAGSLIILSPALLHKHQDIWDQPEVFQADRFLGKFPRESFIPFGAGLRQCIGKDFAYVEGVLLLSAMLRKFQARFPDGAQFPESEPLVTIRPKGGVKLIISPRA
jgi:cytochrome P450